MNPMLLILGGVGLWILLKKKSEDDLSNPISPGNIVNLPEVVVPGSVP
jgi:hypothetical protein